MCVYEYERVHVELGVLKHRTEGYQERIAARAQDGWRYVGFIPILQTGYGLITEMDLVFEKEAP